MLHKVDEDDYSFREEVTRTLGQLGSEAAIPVLLQALHDTNLVAREIAASVLGQLGTEAAIPGLLQALHDEESVVRRCANFALTKIGNPQLLPTLCERLQKTSDSELLNIISAIQKRCKFYNYTLTQLPQMEDKPKSEVKRDQVFISYSHKDKKYLEKLQAALKPIMRNNTILVWDDTKIKAGAKWRDEIKKALARANVAVLMVSANFLASDFIAKQELPPLLKAAEQEGLKIIWVPVGYCLYGETEIEQYQAVHNPSQPLESLRGPKLNEVLVKICQEIKAVSTATDE